MTKDNTQLVNPAIEQQFAVGVEHVANNNITEAVRIFNQILRQQPGYVEALLELSKLFLKAQKVEDIFPYIVEAEKYVQDARISHLRANYYYIKGDLDNAAIYYRKAITQDKKLSMAYRGLSASKKFKDKKEADRLIAQINHILPSIMHFQERAHLFFALGKICDDQKRYDEAFSHYHLANRLMQRIRVYPKELIENTVDKVIALFTPEFIKELQVYGNDSAVPVFMVGVPRSGKTLLENNLSNHKDIAPLGETAIFQRVIEQATNQSTKQLPFPDSVRNINEDQIRDCAAQYLEQAKMLVERISKDAYKRAINTMPQNFIYVGLIAILFPNAKIIYSKRNSLDNGLSCFVQYFSELNEFSYDLGHIGHYMKHCEHVMQFWQQNSSLAIHEISYEDYIADIEGETKKILAFLELEWDSECLTQNERSIYTSSAWQARQPIYSSSVGRWKHYEKHLQELIDVLGQDSL